VQQPPSQPPPPPPPPPAGPIPPYGYAQPFGYAQPYGYAPPPRANRRRWWIFGCGGCAALALVAIALIAVVGIHTFTSSPLRHFPTEAGAATVRDNFNDTNGQSSETIVIDDPHALTDVETYYQSALHTGGWTVDTADPSQAASGDQWHFSKSGSSAQAGLISFATVGATTQITVEYVY
jgi:hypothetical protein